MVAVAVGASGGGCGSGLGLLWVGFFCFGEDIHTKERGRNKEGGIDKVENNK